MSTDQYLLHPVIDGVASGMGFRFGLQELPKAKEIATAWAMKNQIHYVLFCDSIDGRGEMVFHVDPSIG